MKKVFLKQIIQVQLTQEGIDSKDRYNETFFLA